VALSWSEVGKMVINIANDSTQYGQPIKEDSLFACRDIKMFRFKIRRKISQTEAIVLGYAMDKAT
jgi:hypothetical protein